MLGCCLFGDVQIVGNFLEFRVAGDRKVARFSSREQRFVLGIGQSEPVRAARGIVRMQSGHAVDVNREIVLLIELVELREVGRVVKSERKLPGAVALRLQNRSPRVVQAVQERFVFGIPLDVVQHAPVDTRERLDVLDDIAGSELLFELVVVGSVHPEKRNTRLPERNESFKGD